MPVNYAFFQSCVMYVRPIVIHKWFFYIRIVFTFTYSPEPWHRSGEIQLFVDLIRLYKFRSGQVLLHNVFRKNIFYLIFCTRVYSTRDEMYETRWLDAGALLQELRNLFEYRRTKINTYTYTYLRNLRIYYKRIIKASLVKSTVIYFIKIHQRFSNHRKSHFSSFSL